MSKAPPGEVAGRVIFRDSPGCAQGLRLSRPHARRAGRLPVGAGWALEPKLDGFGSSVSTCGGFRVRATGRSEYDRLHQARQSTYERPLVLLRRSRRPLHRRLPRHLE